MHPVPASEYRTATKKAAPKGGLFVSHTSAYLQTACLLNAYLLNAYLLNAC